MSGMVLLAELLLVAGILYGGYRLATRPEGRMSVVDPDRNPAERDQGPLTADGLVAMHIPMGFGYRKVDVDRAARSRRTAVAARHLRTDVELRRARLPDEGGRGWLSSS